MKYYAVTDDINELYHYGVKGMKWGQHLFGDDLRPKSSAYKRAAKKLKGLSVREFMRKDPEARTNEKYQKQVQKALKRTAISEQKHKLDLVRDKFNANEKAYKDAQRAIKTRERVMRDRDRYAQRLERSQVKQIHKAAKAEKKFDRYLQDAREGHLRAGKLSDEQIQRINDRLNLERQARQLGGSEKASYRSRKREAFREGKIEGIKRGTAAGMEELARGLVNAGVVSRLVKGANNRSEAKRQRTKNRIINKKTAHERHAEMRRNLRDEAYQNKLLDEKYYNGKLAILNRLDPTRRAAEKVALKKKEDEANRLDNELYRDAYKSWMQPKKGENADQYRKRITSPESDELKELLRSSTYRDPNAPKYRRRTVRNDLDDLADRIGSVYDWVEKTDRKINDKTKKYRKKVRDAFFDYPDIQERLTRQSKPDTNSKPHQVNDLFDWEPTVSDNDINRRWRDDFFSGRKKNGRKK